MQQRGRGRRGGGREQLNTKGGGVSKGGEGGRGKGRGGERFTFALCTHVCRERADHNVVLLKLLGKIGNAPPCDRRFWKLY